MIAAGVAQVTAMQVSGHKTDSMFRRYAIVSETAAAQDSPNILATVTAWHYSSELLGGFCGSVSGEVRAALVSRFCFLSSNAFISFTSSSSFWGVLFVRGQLGKFHPPCAVFSACW